eukprot:CAMPEP_0206222570 /NCGR_PEP_ID=MMETSP0047_2-20121206/6027_1 /ASSEMBLY_ACC=CAM_ASM_000192 /TAXON_ID=195065 /ORGANISM="Chroomonas mesostigmatica_cf, Strain CCMP1168" /LENGTH=161 /DNA_ID=CAMNT_0053645397 /DNA_START=733 /DNA_END=1219 /DNA_ORIENTATION=+
MSQELSLVLAQKVVEAPDCIKGPIAVVCRHVARLKLVILHKELPHNNARIRGPLPHEREDVHDVLLGDALREALPLQQPVLRLYQHRVGDIRQKKHHGSPHVARVGARVLFWLLFVERVALDALRHPHVRLCFTLLGDHQEPLPVRQPLLPLAPDLLDSSE